MAVTRLPNTEGPWLLCTVLLLVMVIGTKPTGQWERPQIRPFTHSLVTTGLQPETFCTWVHFIRPDAPLQGSIN